MTAAWPNARLVHLPVHASWLNQIEIVFSIIQRKVIKPADFADLATLWRIVSAASRTATTQTAQPFDWRFTRSDLTTMLHRVDTERSNPRRRSPPEHSGSARLGSHESAVRSRPKHSLTVRLNEHARNHWPALAGVDVRFRPTSPTSTDAAPTARSSNSAGCATAAPPTTGASPSTEPATTTTKTHTCPTGTPVGTPEQALDCACTLYVDDPHPSPRDTPTN